MLELALMEDLVSLVAEQMVDVEVHVVRLELGQGAGFTAEAMRSCFDERSRGTPLERARLEIVPMSGRALTSKKWR